MKNIVLWFKSYHNGRLDLAKKDFVDRWKWNIANPLVNLDLIFTIDNPEEDFEHLKFSINGLMVGLKSRMLWSPSSSPDTIASIYFKRLEVFLK